MLISAKNIFSSVQRSAFGVQCLEIELPLSKSESNRALMIMHYAESQSHKVVETQSVMSDSDDTVLLQKHLNTLNKYLQGSLSGDCCPLTLELDCHNAGTVFRFLMTAVAVAETQSRRDANLTVRVDSQSRQSESTVRVNSQCLTNRQRSYEKPSDRFLGRCVEESWRCYRI